MKKPFSPPQAMQKRYIGEIFKELLVTDDKPSGKHRNEHQQKYNGRG